MNTALVLSGGGARGAAHIGVLQALTEQQMDFPIVTGTSAGSLVGGFYAAGFTPSEITHISNQINWSIFPVRWLALLSNLIRCSFHAPKTPYINTDSLISTKQFEKILKKYLGNMSINDTPRTFATPAVDLHTGETVVFSNSPLLQSEDPIIKEAKLWESMRASMAIPVVFSPLSIPPWLLVDGGVTENFPVDLAASLGVDKIIAVDVRPPLPPLQPVNFIQIGLRSFDIMGLELSEWTTSIPVQVINPDVNDIGTLDFNRIDEAIAAGYKAGIKFLEENG